MWLHFCLKYIVCARVHACVFCVCVSLCVCVYVCYMDMKTHHTYLPPKKDVLMSVSPFRSCPAAEPPLPLSCSREQGLGTPWWRQEQRLVSQVRQRTTLMGCSHSSAPRRASEAVSRPAYLSSASLSTQCCFPPLLPTGQFWRSVQHNKLHLRICFPEKPASDFYKLSTKDWSFFPTHQFFSKSPRCHLSCSHDV